MQEQLPVGQSILGQPPSGVVSDLSRRPDNLVTVIMATLFLA